MSSKSRGIWLGVTSLALALVAGCQTWNMEAGLTLPTGHYLSHQPQYFPPSPPYPLQKELNGLEDEHRRQLEENQRGGGL